MPNDKKIEDHIEEIFQELSPDKSLLNDDSEVNFGSFSKSDNNIPSDLHDIPASRKKSELSDYLPAAYLGATLLTGIVHYLVLENHPELKFHMPPRGPEMKNVLGIFFLPVYAVGSSLFLTALGKIMSPNTYRHFEALFVSYISVFAGAGLGNLLAYTPGYVVGATLATTITTLALDRSRQAEYAIKNFIQRM
ncbi:MAG: hypothetical protein ACMXYG_04540 [Candidatus Woesearchaeota archaeon]